MDKETYKLFYERIVDNIYQNLQEKQDNPLMEHYCAKNVESYMRSLEILERMKNKWQD